MAKENVKQEGRASKGKAGRIIAKFLGVLAFLGAACTVLPKIAQKMSNWLYKVSLHRSNKKREKDWGPVVKKIDKGEK